MKVKEKVEYKFLISKAGALKLTRRSETLRRAGAMRTKFLILVLFCPFIAYCQISTDIVISKNLVEYEIIDEQGISSQFSNLVYTINNSSDSIIWLWFEEKKELSEERKLKDYFFRNKEDVSLFHLLTDANVTFPKEFSPTLFYSFLKYIRPNDTFTIQICFSQKLSDANKEAIYKYLEEHLVIISDTKLHRYIKLSNFEQLNQEVFYKEYSIVLPVDFVKIDCLESNE